MTRSGLFRLPSSVLDLVRNHVAINSSKSGNRQLASAITFPRLSTCIFSNARFCSQEVRDRGPLWDAKQKQTHRLRDKMSRVEDHQITEKGKKSPSVPKPSSSVVLISPTNQVLLLHRVQTSTSFPSAHVFPGGNVSEFHDGRAPEPNEPGRHVDGPAYRLAAIRETFEESGIALAHTSSGRLLELSEQDRETGRKLIHSGKVPFRQWLSEKGGTPDVDGLIPFTRWITPIGPPKRFTTQMYLYFLPTASRVLDRTPLSSTEETLIPTPTPDGGVEHTAAQFLPPQKWIELASSGKIIMFPPQFFLLSMVAQFLKPSPSLSISELEQQRAQLREFARGGDPLWSEVCISPAALIGKLGDGRTVMALDNPGEGLEKKGRRGTKEYVIITEFSKGGPRRLQLKTRKEVMQDLKDDVKNSGTAYSHHLQHIQTKNTREKL
ncbi:hypothetical protein, variant [Verruconis gallopava]|uniref:Nudix hydrolase domain-containing protein n=1 Tax=Verruconis gallopava TaxID=253628 RepID=A0A0D2ANS5_9PEZI|nr:hypothetical protein, variant [Verruconis gallopava]KIW00784.1 hypothetical protein, variant [Verruconis gallopava]